MLSITPAQMVVFEHDYEARMLVRVESYVRAQHVAWAQTRSVAVVRALIAHVQTFGRQHNLREEPSLLRLVDQALGGGWPDPLPALAEHVLTRRGFSEARRIGDWCNALATSTTLVNLEPLVSV